MSHVPGAIEAVRCTGYLLMLIGVGLATENLRRSGQLWRRPWMLGSVWAPLVPVAAGAALSVYGLARSLVACLP
jgi:hypothetical protein